VTLGKSSDSSGSSSNREGQRKGLPGVTDLEEVAWARFNRRLYDGGNFAGSFESECARKRKLPRPTWKRSGEWMSRMPTNICVCVYIWIDVESGEGWGEEWGEERGAERGEGLGRESAYSHKRIKGQADAHSWLYIRVASFFLLVWPFPLSRSPALPCVNVFDRDNDEPVRG
jgi:hypothetical protein